MATSLFPKHFLSRHPSLMKHFIGLELMKLKKHIQLKYSQVIVLTLINTKYLINKNYIFRI